MKKTAIAAAMLCLAAGYVAPVSATDSPCKVTLCLWGKLNGENSNECSSAVKSFFSIKKTSKGSFLPDHTLSARKTFINDECPSEYQAAQFIQQILNKYGRVKNA